ncbi:MAG TPA: hypothetical protein VFA18_05205 [Gemmataceae bacterium]|nr:hypothetical protein [Gemmataceae bacterium]
MNLQQCDRCGTVIHGHEPLDHCATCRCNLCEKCMHAGCCGQIPALSANEEDVDDSDAEESWRGLTWG